MEGPEEGRERAGGAILLRPFGRSELYQPKAVKAIKTIKRFYEWFILFWFAYKSIGYCYSIRPKPTEEEVIIS